MLDAQSQSSDVGVNINVSMEKSSSNVLSFSAGNQRREVITKNDSSDASLMGFFVCAAYASESSSLSERDDVTLFSEYAANTETQSFSVEYNNSFSPVDLGCGLQNRSLRVWQATPIPTKTIPKTMFSPTLD